MSDNKIIFNNKIISEVDKNLNCLLSKINKKKWENILSFNCNGYNKSIYSKTIKLDLSEFIDFDISKVKITEINIKNNFINLYILGDINNIFNIKTKFIEYVVIKKNIDNEEIQKINFNNLFEYGKRNDIGIVIFYDNYECSKILEDINYWLGISKIDILISTVDIKIENIPVKTQINICKKNIFHKKDEIYSNKFMHKQLEIFFKYFNKSKNQFNLGYYNLYKYKLKDILLNQKKNNLKEHSILNNYPKKYKDSLNQKIENYSNYDKFKSLIDLVFINCLLDTYTGSQWYYFDNFTNEYYYNSIGISVIIIKLFMKGIFSNSIENKLQVTSDKLINFNLKFLKDFMLAEANIIGLKNKFSLIINLGKSLKKNNLNRPSDIFDRYNKNDKLSVNDLWEIIINDMKNIWKLKLDNKIAGDISNCNLIRETLKDNSEKIAFHQISQWIIYSIIHINKIYKIFILTDTNILTPISWYNLYLLLIHYKVYTEEKNIKKKYNINSEKVVISRALTIVIYNDIFKEINESIKDKFTLSEFIENGPLKLFNELEINKSYYLNIDKEGIYF